MNIRPIKTDADYRDTLREIETLMSVEAGTDAGDHLDVLVTLVEAYERAHFPMDLPDAMEVIRFRMEQHLSRFGSSRTDAPDGDAVTAEYERLRRQDRRVYATSQLPASLQAVIAAAKPSALAASFNHEAKKK